MNNEKLVLILKSFDNPKKAKDLFVPNPVEVDHILSEIFDGNSLEDTNRKKLQ